MVRSSRQEKYLQLQKQFPFFIFEKQEYMLTTGGLAISFTFNLADQYEFKPSLFIPRKSIFLDDEIILNQLDNIVFNLGMIELISYWKAACPPNLIIKPFSLHPEQIAWWKKLYFHGLGEFFYLNGLVVALDDFMKIDVAETHRGASLPIDGASLPIHGASLPLVIIPIGGGKDSAVTLELLGSQPGNIPLIINPRGASLETIAVKGYSTDQFIEVQRTIDPLLLKLNTEGFLNGHTPFSAMLAFVTVLAAIVTGGKHIALSNESSANEATIEGTEINHQYSKSFQFETDFRSYVRRWISDDINYFSFLRPVNELQIASLFSQFPGYHSVFKSCNAGSKSDSWCGKCAKCLFTYTILSPFINPARLKVIFGKDLFSDVTLKPLFDQLTGVADEKPFDCVGTVREVNLAICETIKQCDVSQLPYLLDYYRNSQAYARYCLTDFRTELATLSGEHYLLPEFLEVLERLVKG